MGDDIRGVENGQDSGIRYTQDSNANEAIIKKAKTEMAQEIEDKLRKSMLVISGEMLEIIIKIVWSRVKWLENCGPSTFSTLMEGIGVLYREIYPTINGQFIQMDDWHSDFLNDPKKDNIFSKGDSFDNRTMKNYVRLVKMLYPEVDVVFKEFTWSEITTKIYEGWGAQLCLVSPGHYVAGLKFNKTKGLILYADSWVGNTMSWNGKKLVQHGGWDEEMDKNMYEKNTIGYAIIYRKKSA